MKQKAQITRPTRLAPLRVKMPQLWETADGRLIRMEDMTDTHLESALKLFLGIRLDERKYASFLYHDHFRFDPVLEHRLRQLYSELYYRTKPNSIFIKIVNKISNYFKKEVK